MNTDIITNQSACSDASRAFLDMPVQTHATFRPQKSEEKGDLPTTLSLS